ncbi:hypothetical protein KEM48_004894 [Puccinia striiformis f. sp. tritici PST-130]|nr:hypothetical protein Pst134EB_008117 [Puccinia striiformis f. sp. tritici]KAI9617441.1 hypothetical protein KEM48_004894 [Puccinia striiformis f. sp. tritici PST-130]
MSGSEELSGHDSEAEARSTRSPEERVVDAFDNLGNQYHIALTTIYYPTENGLMKDELAGRHELIEELRSMLLPSIKEDLDFLLLGLDLQELDKHPSPDVELTIEATTNLDQTLDKITRSVHCISAPFPQGDINDCHLRRCKRFMRKQLHNKVRSVITKHLCQLFWTCIYFISACKLSNDEPEDLEHRSKTSQWTKELLRVRDLCRDSIDDTIEWCQKSEFTVLQEGWLEAEGLISGVLETITKLVNPVLTLEQKVDSIDIDDEENGNIKVQTDQLHKATQSIIPIIKLARIFLNKIAKPTKAEIPFTLDKEISSDDLELLRDGTSRIATRLKSLAEIAVELHEANNGFGDNRELMGRLIICLFADLEAILLLLSLYLIPLPTTGLTNYKSGNQFKTWFHGLETLWRKATHHYLDALAYSEDEDEDESEEVD